MESYYLAYLTNDEKYLYPGLQQSVEPNTTDCPDGAKKLWPVPFRPQKWVGTARHRILRIDTTDRRVTAVGCVFSYGSVAETDFGLRPIIGERFAASDPTGVNNPTPAALAYIGRLLGLTTAGALRLPNSSLHPPDIDAEIVEVKYVLADSFLARTPALGFAAKYIADKKLMSPEDVRDQFGDGGYYDYTRHLEVFLQEAGNINSLVEHEVRGQYEFAAGAAAQ